MESTFERSLKERLNQTVNLSEAASDTILKSAGLDHPDFESIEFGDLVLGEGVVIFVDTRGFTRLSMAFKDAPEKTAKILDAVIGASVDALLEHGAHINDFTGDGVMAIFGGRPGTLDLAHDQAIWAAAQLMTDMQGTLRDELLQVGVDDPVQVAMGLVSGPLAWKRIGAFAGPSRVAAIGEVPPLASKYVSGGETKAWQTMIGGDVIDAVPSQFREQVADFEREYNNQRMTRPRWLLDTNALWRRTGSASEVGHLRRASAINALGVSSVDPSPDRSGQANRSERIIG